MKGIIKKTTIHYEWCIENLPMENPLQFCKDNFVHNGICRFISYVLRKHVYGSNFSKEFSKGNAYLCSPPKDLTTFEEIILTLRTRHKRLLEMSDYTE